MTIYTDEDAHIAQPKKKETLYSTIEADLYLVVQPNGKKTWRYVYHDGFDKTSLTLGTFPNMGLCFALLYRRGCAEYVNNNKDPNDYLLSQKLRDSKGKMFTLVNKVIGDIFRLEKELEWVNCQLEMALEREQHNLTLAHNLSIKCADLMSAGKDGLEAPCATAIPAQDTLPDQAQVARKNSKKPQHLLQARFFERVDQGHFDLSMC